MKKSSLYLILIASIFFSSPLYSVELKGRLTSELYTFKQNDTSHVRPYESLRSSLLLWSGSSSKRVSFNSYIRYASDFGESETDFSNSFIYDSYLKIEGLPGHSTGYLGRQFVYTSAGSSLIDGIRITLKPHKSMRLNAFYGSHANRLRPDKFQSLSDEATAGGQMSYYLNSTSQVGLNYFYQKRDGFITRNNLTLDSRLRGLNWRWFNRLAYALTKNNIYEILTRLTFRPENWYLSGEFRKRKPNSPANSIFSLLDSDGYTEWRFEARKKTSYKIDIESRLQISNFSEDDIYRIQLGIRGTWYNLGWSRQYGRGTNRSGLYGSLSRPIRWGWRGYARFNLYRYRVQGEQIDQSDAYSSGFGLSRSFKPSMLFMVEMQYLKNAVQKNDLRFLFRLIKDFSIGRK